METKTPNTAGTPGENPEVITVRLPKGTLMEFEKTSHAVVRAALARRRQGGPALWLKCISAKFPDFYGAIFESVPSEPSAMLPLPLHAPSPKMEHTPETKKPAPPSTSTASPTLPSEPPKPTQPRKKPSGPEMS